MTLVGYPGVLADLPSTVTSPRGWPRGGGQIIPWPPPLSTLSDAQASAPRVPGDFLTTGIHPTCVGAAGLTAPHQQAGPSVTQNTGGGGRGVSHRLCGESSDTGEEADKPDGRAEGHDSVYMKRPEQGDLQRREMDSLGLRALSGRWKWARQSGWWTHSLGSALHTTNDSVNNGHWSASYCVTWPHTPCDPAARSPGKSQLPSPMEDGGAAPGLLQALPMVPGWCCGASGLWVP